MDEAGAHADAKFADLVDVMHGLKQDLCHLDEAAKEQQHEQQPKEKRFNLQQLLQDVDQVLTHGGYQDVTLEDVAWQGEGEDEAGDDFRWNPEAAPWHQPSEAAPAPHGDTWDTSEAQDPWASDRWDQWQDAWKQEKKAAEEELAPPMPEQDMSLRYQAGSSDDEEMQECKQYEEYKNFKRALYNNETS